MNRDEIAVNGLGKSRGETKRKYFWRGTEMIFAEKGRVLQSKDRFIR